MNQRRRAVFATAVTLLAQACSAEHTECEFGTFTTCGCPDYSVGQRTCTTDLLWSDCACPEPLDAGIDAGVTADGTSPDVAQIDSTAPVLCDADLDGFPSPACGWNDCCDTDPLAYPGQAEFGVWVFIDHARE